MKAEKGNTIQVINPADPLCGATAIVTRVKTKEEYGIDGVEVVILTLPPNNSTKITKGDEEFFTDGFAVVPVMECPWDFVERYLYKYYNDERVAYSDDLQKIVDNELEDDSTALEVLNEDYNGDREGNLETIKKDLAVVDCDIYRTAIKNYINKQNNEE